MTITRKSASGPAQQSRPTKNKKPHAIPKGVRTPAKGEVEVKGKDATPYTVSSSPRLGGVVARSRKYVSVRIEKELMDQLDLARNDRLVGHVTDGILVLRPERYLDDRDVEKLTSEVMDEYEDVLSKLAE